MKAINETRDKIDDYSQRGSRPGKRYVSLDFNHSGQDKPASGILVKMPDDATDLEIDLATQYAAMTKAFFRSYGHDVPLHADKGLKWDGRGAAGVMHTEPFFIGDTISRIIIEDHISEYCWILAGSLGQIPGATFILPHKSYDGGAQSRDGKINERDFAMYKIMPKLKRICGDDEYEMALPFIPSDRPDNDIYLAARLVSNTPQVSFTETKVT